MLYTSKESWDYVEFRFSKKKYDLLKKKWFNFDFSDFRVKIEADQMPSKRDSWNFWKKKFKKWICQDLLGIERNKVKKNEPIWSTLQKSTGEKPQGGTLCPPAM